MIKAAFPCLILSTLKSSIAEVARDISETSALATELETDDFDSEFEKK